MVFGQLEASGATSFYSPHLSASFLPSSPDFPVPFLSASPTSFYPSSIGRVYTSETFAACSKNPSLFFPGLSRIVSTTSSQHTLASSHFPRAHDSLATRHHICASASSAVPEAAALPLPPAVAQFATGCFGLVICSRATGGRVGGLPLEEIRQDRCGAVCIEQLLRKKDVDKTVL